MKKEIPGTLIHYNEIARIISTKSSKLTGNKKAINAHVGGQFFLSPNRMALAAHVHHTLNHTSLLGFLDDEAEKRGMLLTELLKEFSPLNGYFIDLDKGYRDLWKNSDMSHLGFNDFLDHRKKQKISSTGYLDHCHGQEESLMLMKNYFNNQGIPAEKNQVVLGTGFKNLFNAFITVLMTKELKLDSSGRDLRERESGSILVPRGHYHSLVKAPSFHNSRLKVIEKIDSDNIRGELENRGDIKAIYFSVVANPTGEIMPEKQIRGIAEAVLEYNRKNRDNPVFVVADQVYNGSILKEGLDIFSIASVGGKSGRMFDYTITIVSPSKTLGYASARISFAASGIKIPGDREDLISRIGSTLGEEGSDGVEVSTEVGVVGAYAFSSKKWIKDNSSYIKSQLKRAETHVKSINNYLGRDFFSINDPDAGWYILSKFPLKNLPSGIKDSADLLIYFMNYSHASSNTGVICRPGIQFGFETPHLPPLDFLILRSTLAMGEEDLDDFFRRFGEGIRKLAMLRKLENIEAETIQSCLDNPDTLKLFNEKAEKDLLVTSNEERISSFFVKTGTAESIREKIIEYTYKELRTILEK